MRNIPVQNYIRSIRNLFIRLRQYKLYFKLLPLLYLKFRKLLLSSLISVGQLYNIKNFIYYIIYYVGK